MRRMRLTEELTALVPPFSGESGRLAGRSDLPTEAEYAAAMAELMAERRQPGTFHMQQGYDHSYFFVSSFIRDHVAFHAEALYR